MKQLDQLLNNSIMFFFRVLFRSLSVALSEELVKPLKVAVESQHRVRKAVESGVDKTGRMLAEWRSAQAKAKKHCYMSARENEKMQDQVFINKPRVLTDKETAKLEAKCKKTQEAVRKVKSITTTDRELWWVTFRLDLIFWHGILFF